MCRSALGPTAPSADGPSIELSVYRPAVRLVTSPRERTEQMKPTIPLPDATPRP